MHQLLAGRLLVSPLGCALLCLASIPSLADTEIAACTLDIPDLYRGERSMARICGKGITANHELHGLDAAGIELIYRQDLKQCDPADRRSGLLLELAAGRAATNARIRISDATSDTATCEVILPVPEQHLLPPGHLTPLGPDQLYRLHIAGDEMTDLTGACDTEFYFPGGSGPPIALATPAPRCEASQIEATVRVMPGRRLPAQLILDARNKNGARIKTISHIEPPETFFADTMAEADAKFVDVNGVRTRYFDKGQGEVLLLVHGGQPSAPDFNAWEWQQNFDGLSEHFRVIALDRIGQGYTDNPPSVDDYDRYYLLVVEHLLGFLDALRLQRVHLVGHSQGGWPVTRIALDHPKRVASLVIVDSTMVALSSNPAQAVRFYLYQQNQLHPATGPTPQSIRRGLEFFSHTNNNITEQRVNRILTIAQTDKYQQAREWFGKSLMSPAHPSFRRLKEAIWAELQAGKLEVPTLIIWGREDPEGSFPAGVAMHEALEAAGSAVTFYAFENAGHVSYMEYPERFNTIVTEFCQAN